MIYKKGEVWKVADRHGKMTIILLEDVDDEKDMFFKATILNGKKEFLGQLYNELQEENGKGSFEEVSDFRTGLCRFKERLIDLESKKRQERLR